MGVRDSYNESATGPINLPGESLTRGGKSSRESINFQVENSESKKVILFILFILPWFFYFHTLSYPFFFDDFANIVSNLDIQDLSQILKKLITRSGFGMGQNDPSRPITFLTYALNYSLARFNPVGYRALNLLVHSSASVVLFLLTQRLIKLNFQKEIPSLAFFIALLFCAHPLQLEVATYISGRADGLSTLFYLLSLLLFMKSQEHRLYGAFSIFTFILCFWSKPIGVTFPAMALCFDFLFLPRSQIKQRIWIHLSYWTLLISFLIFRVVYLGGLGDRVTDPFSHWTRLTYFLTQPYCILKYIQLLLLPLGQSVDHFIEPSQSLFDSRTLSSLFALAGLLLLAIRFAIRFPLYKKWVWFSLLWFFVTLSPTSSLFPINDAMTERRLYLPCWGFFLLLGSLTHHARSRTQKALPIFLVYVLVLSLLSWKRSYLFKDPLSPWQEAVQLYSKNTRAQYNLGNEYLKEGNFLKAKERYEAALNLNNQLAEPHNNLGIILVAQRHYREAEFHFKKALQIKPLRDAENNLRNLQLQMKQSRN